MQSENVAIPVFVALLNDDKHSDNYGTTECQSMANKICASSNNKMFFTNCMNICKMNFAK